MKTLSICSILPHPEHRGDPIRVSAILQALEVLGDSHVWCVASTGGDPDGLRTKLPRSTVRIFEPDEPGWFRRRGAWARYAVAATEGIPVWVRQRASTDLAKQLVREYTNFDRVLFLGEAAVQNAHASLHGWHWDRTNILSASGRDAVREAQGLSKVASLVNWSASKRYERRHARRALTVSVTNEQEMVRYSNHLGAGPVSIVRSTVPIPSSPARRPDAKTLLWLGSFAYGSNLQGLFRFLNDTDEHLDARGWTVRMVGSGLTEDARNRLTKYRSATIVGFVEDLAPELERATAGIVPLWSGGGTKMKTLTMVAAGVPVFGTEDGVEGLPTAYAGIAFHVAQEPAALVTAIEDAQRSGSLEHMGRLAHELCLRFFDTTSLVDDLGTILSGLGAT